MKEMITQLITAFLGAFGFAVLFQVGKEKLLSASLGGLLAWSFYLLSGLLSESEVLRFFLSAVVITAYAEYMARKDKAPATVFLVPAAVPLIPGGSLYQTMSYALREEWRSFLGQGLMTILLAAAISCGVLTTMTCMKIYHKTRERLSRGLRKPENGRDRAG